MDIHTLNPYIRVAKPSVLKKGSVIAQRILFDYELIYVERGHFTLHYDGTPYDCHTGQFLFLRPDIPHAFDFTAEEVSQPHVHFDLIFGADSHRTPISFKDRPDLLPAERSLVQQDLFSAYPRIPLVSFAEPDTAQHLLEQTIAAFHRGRLLAAKGHLTELCGLLIEDNFPSFFHEYPNNEHAVTRQIKDFIDAKHGVGICLDALEKQFSYDKFYLERQFRKEYGQSLIAYSRQKTMEQAAVLLCKQTVSTVSDALGFSSIYAFSRAFKRHFGLSPSAYRKNML